MKSKIYNLIICNLLVSVIALNLSCTKTISGNLSVTGVATATPSVLSNEDMVTLTIGGSATGMGKKSVNGSDYYPIIHYMIDSTEVVISTEHDFPFRATYVVSNLQPGEHTLSVNITSNHSGIYFENRVSSSKIVID